MTVLLTGATGRLGRRVRERLAVEGVPVLAVGSPSSAADEGLIPLDLADGAAVSALVESVRPSTVIHLGAAVESAGRLPLDALRAINVDSTRRLAGGPGPIRFIFASTAGVYGDSRTAPLDERAESPAPSAYAQSKLEAEAVLAESAAVRPELSVVVLRIFNIYGPGFTSSLVNRLGESTAERPVELQGWDHFVRDYVHVDDVVEATLAARLASVEFEVVNIASGRARNNAALVDELGANRELFYRVAGDSRSSSVADISKARELLGFRPTIELRMPA